MATPVLNHATVIAAVRQWPRDAQVALAQEILRDTVALEEHQKAGAPAPGGSWRNLIGLLATDQPPPSDEEIERWREEHRLEKYGR